MTASPAAESASAPGPWQGAMVTDIRVETARARTFRLRLERPERHRAGQHYIVRLTAPDGYRAQRSYSIASAPDDAGEVELTVERLEDGEVSSFLHDEVVVGDELEVRGPIGGWFVWDGAGPAVLLGGGSGVVPLMSMLRLARRTETANLIQLFASVRRPDDLLYRDEITGPETTLVYTREAPPGSARPVGRLVASDLAGAFTDGVPEDATCYVCGSAGFADAASQLLVDLGVDAARIRVERFGPTA